MLPVKRAPLILLLLIPTTTKSSPVVVTASLPSPWKMLPHLLKLPTWSPTYVYVTFNAVAISKVE